MRRAPGLRFRWLAILSLLILTIGFASDAKAQIELPPADPNKPLKIFADGGSKWHDGTYEVWHLQGRVRLSQGGVNTQSREAILWIDRSAGGMKPHKVVAYLEGSVRVGYPPNNEARHALQTAGTTFTGPSWTGRFYSRAPLELQLPPAQAAPQVKPAIYHRGIADWMPQPRSIPKTGVQPAQYVPGIEPTSPLVAPGNFRRIRVTPRDGGGIQAQWFPNQATNERIAVIDNGVNLVVESADPAGNIDVSTDRLVIWTPGDGLPDLGGENVQAENVPLEIYMEGNIVFRYGDRRIYARAMYYNVSQRRGVVYDAELLTPVPSHQGLVRLKAKVLYQIDAGNFEAQDAALTTSRLAVPTYWFQSKNIRFQDQQFPVVDPFTGEPHFDPVTGQPIIEHQTLASSRNNLIYLKSWPILYWPFMATDARKPNFYLEEIKLGSDNVFGTQIRTDWDMYQILGWTRKPEGTDWTTSLDYLSDRGFGVGTLFEYDRVDFFGIPGRYHGSVDAWGLHDDGLDNLGRDRRMLTPERKQRGRIYARHRHYLPNELQLTSEIGYISDRNFLEQYYEHEWDEFKDQSTGLELKQYLGNTTWSISGDLRVNDFFAQTEGGRFDHFLIGQSLLHDHLTWHAHSNVGYEKLEVADAPLDPVDAAKFTPMTWESPAEGLRGATRHEIDLPISLGPGKVVPYLLGELATWNEDLTSSNVDRAYGQIGLRASLPMWKRNPEFQSQLFNLNGLAHKIVFEGEFFYADASRDLSRFPLYDELDDDSVEAFRRRYPTDNFGGLAIPTMYDERYFALRSGLQNSVTSPSTEIADDLMLGRVGISQRWQTRRGLPGRERIVDWIVLDVEGLFYPRPSRDNFGSSVGMLQYDFRWHVGDRVTLLSDGFFDTFDGGLRTASIGGFISRPGLGDGYIGIRSIEGPISSNVLSSSAHYRMTEKWILTVGGSIDLSDTKNIGQKMEVTRIGESFLLTLGVTGDASRGSFGANFLLEPRFLKASRRATLGGLPLPPVGAYGIE